MPVVMAQASRLACKAPFCVARHALKPSPGRSLWNLRGFSLHTTLSGCKNSSRWCCHGLLVVEGAQGEGLLNPSPRQIGFDPVDDPGLFIISLRNACTPQDHVWRSLRAG